MVPWEAMLAGLAYIDLLVIDVWGESRQAHPARGGGRSQADSKGARPSLETAPNSTVDGGVAAMLMAFPLDRLKPSLIYYRHPAGRKATAALREHLLAHGYQTSAHWETGAWGEHNLAWRADRCGLR